MASHRGLTAAGCAVRGTPVHRPSISPLFIGVGTVHSISIAPPAFGRDFQFVLHVFAPAEFLFGFMRICRGLWIYMGFHEGVRKNDKATTHLRICIRTLHPTCNMCICKNHQARRWCAYQQSTHLRSLVYCIGVFLRLFLCFVSFRFVSLRSTRCKFHLSIRADTRKRYAITVYLSHSVHGLEQDQQPLSFLSICMYFLLPTSFFLLIRVSFLSFSNLSYLFFDSSLFSLLYTF